LGSAAAAYNAGPARVASWLRGDGDLPAVTRAYVRFVTRNDEDGGGDGIEAQDAGQAAAPLETCLAVTAGLRRDHGEAVGDALGLAPLAPWGVQLAGNFSKGLALAAFERSRMRDADIVGEARPMITGRLLRSRRPRPFYQVRLPAASRAEASILCRRIQSAGRACLALRSCAR